MTAHRIGQSPWLDGTLDRRMAELLAEWRSAGYIGQELGVSRNAVIGRIHRTGMQLLTKPSGNPKPHRKHKPQPAAKKFGAAVPKLRPLPVCDVPAPVLGTVGLTDLRWHHCRYPFGDAPPYSFCGHPKAFGHSWCDAHCRVVYASGRAA